MGSQLVLLKQNDSVTGAGTEFTLDTEKDVVLEPGRPVTVKAPFKLEPVNEFLPNISFTAVLDFDAASLGLVLSSFRLKSGKFEAVVVNVSNKAVELPSSYPAFTVTMNEPIFYRAIKSEE